MNNKEVPVLLLTGYLGSGKTTLLNCISTIDTVSAGHIYLDGTDVTEINEKQIARFRRENLGFVFQDFNLLDTFSLKDNIFLPLVLSGKPYDEMAKRLKPLAEKLGITDILSKFPYEVSGGQKQRVALARALVNRPNIIIADEPTAALDKATADEIMEVMKSLNSIGKTIVIVTHDRTVAEKCRRIVELSDGKIISDRTIA